MSPTTAIQRAEQWRKENACGEAAKVAIALLNELERVQALYTSLQSVQEICGFEHDSPEADSEWFSEWLQSAEEKSK